MKKNHQGKYKYNLVVLHSVQQLQHFDWTRLTKILNSIVPNEYIHLNKIKVLTKNGNIHQSSRLTIGNRIHIKNIYDFMYKTSDIDNCFMSRKKSKIEYFLSKWY